MLGVTLRVASLLWSFLLLRPRFPLWLFLMLRPGLSRRT
jgi:hypothetical protein